MNARKTTATLDHVITSLLLALIFLFLNLSVSDSTLSTDFSGSGFYTLQQPSIDMLNDLNSPLKITYYHTPQLAPRTPKYSNMQQRVRSLLRLYKQYGGGNFQFEIRNPAEQEGKNQITRDVENRLLQNQIVPVKEKVDRQGRESSYKFYSSFRITYRANERVINKVTSIDDLEYLLSQEIKYAMHPELVRIGLYVPPRMQRSRRRGRLGRGGGGMQRTKDSDSFSTLETRLREIGVVERIYLEKGDRFPDPSNDESIDLLLVLANRKIPESDLYALDQFIMNGGKALIAADPVGLKPGGRMAMMRGGGGERRGFLFSDSGSDKTLLDLLKSYGVKGSASVTIDRTEVAIPRNERRVKREKTIGGETKRRMYIETVDVSVPFIFKATPSLSGNVPTFVTRAGTPLVLYPMGLKQSKKKKDVQYTPWLTTGPESVEIEPPSGGGPMGRGGGLGEFHQKTMGYRFDRVASEHKSKRDLVVSLRSKFSSAFKEENIPEAMKPGSGAEEKSEEKASQGSDDQEQPSKDDSNTANDENKNIEHVVESPETHIVVTGDTDLFKLNQMTRLRQQLLEEKSMESPNERFATEAVSHLNRGEKQKLDLERERVKTPRLVEVDKTRQRVYSFLIVGLAPLLLVLFGLIRWGIVASGRKQIDV